MRFEERIAIYADEQGPGARWRGSTVLWMSAIYASNRQLKTIEPIGRSWQPFSQMQSWQWGALQIHLPVFSRQIERPPPDRALDRMSSRCGISIDLGSFGTLDLKHQLPSFFRCSATVCTPGDFPQVV